LELGESWQSAPCGNDDMEDDRHVWALMTDEAGILGVLRLLYWGCRDRGLALSDAEFRSVYRLLGMDVDDIIRRVVLVARRLCTGWVA